MSWPRPGKKIALIVTAIPVEFEAVLAHFSTPRERVLSSGLIARDGTIPGTWEATVIQTGEGNTLAALETDRAVNEVNPAAVVFVGIAGGRKDVDLGDVVVGSKIYYYESGKDAETFLPRPEVFRPSNRLFRRSEDVARSQEWQKLIILPTGTSTPRKPNVLTKPIAAGEILLASTKSQTAEVLTANYGDAVAVEMEGYGFLRALHAHPERQSVVIRGISDLIDGKTESEHAGWQPVAAAHAAAFAIDLLSKFDIDTTDQVAERVGEFGDRLSNLEDNFWSDLVRTLAKLYPAGPQDRRIWARAGGDPSRLILSEDGMTMWYDGIQLMRNGGGLDPNELMRIVRSDFPESSAAKLAADAIAAATN